MVNSTPGGGHISHHKAGSVGKYTKNIVNFPLTSDGWHIDVNRTLERDSEERLVAEVLSESAGHAALGVQAVVEAVNEKRARTLVLAERAHLPGGECGRCAVIFADPVPSICPACGEPLEWLPDILPVLAEAVLRQDGQVLELHDAAGRTLLTHGGVATRLRYARPARLSA